ncbi:hypothetical protein HRED_09897, partial [Candidatus Haloredivivus sp. G17]
MLGMVMGTDFNDGIHGIGPKKRPGDGVFDFDNVDGVPALKNNDKAKKFIDQ